MISTLHFKSTQCFAWFFFEVRPLLIQCCIQMLWSLSFSNIFANEREKKGYSVLYDKGKKWSFLVSDLGVLCIPDCVSSIKFLNSLHVSNSFTFTKCDVLL